MSNRKPSALLPGLLLAASVLGVAAFILHGSGDSYTDVHGVAWIITQEYGDVDGLGSWFARDTLAAYGVAPIVLRGQTRALLIEAIGTFAAAHLPK